MRQFPSHLKIHCWLFRALEAQGKLGGEGLTPFYALLDGGKDGELFKELEDYFYYAQIRGCVHNSCKS